MVVGGANMETADGPSQMSPRAEAICIQHGPLPHGQRLPTGAPLLVDLGTSTHLPLSQNQSPPLIGEEISYNLRRGPSKANNLQLC